MANYCTVSIKCGAYLGQGQTQGKCPHEQQMGLDPHHSSVRTARWVDRLVCLQIILGLNPETAHSVYHCLHVRQKKATSVKVRKIAMMTTHTFSQA